MTHYPGSKPMMWLQDANTRLPDLVGCTACNWWTAPPGGTQGRNWHKAVALFNEHRITTHPTDHTHNTINDITNPDDPRHGTYAGYKAHRYRQETACEDCTWAYSETVRERKARYRASRNNGKRKTTRTITNPDDPRHGTYAGYKAHRAQQHTPCDLCRTANQAHERARRAARNPRPPEEMAA